MNKRSRLLVSLGASAVASLLLIGTSVPALWGDSPSRVLHAQDEDTQTESEAAPDTGMGENIFVPSPTATEPATPTATATVTPTPAATTGSSMAPSQPVQRTAVPPTAAAPVQGVPTQREAGSGTGFNTAGGKHPVH